jgi:hypothetical protein
VFTMFVGFWANLLKMARMVLETGQHGCCGFPVSCCDFAVQAFELFWCGSFTTSTKPTVKSSLMNLNSHSAN